MRERKSTRLRNYDYSQNGYYFVTICTRNREEWFGRVENEEMVLSRWGEIVRICWNELIQHYPNCSLDSFVIMPNHVHGIVVINNENIVGNGLKPFPTYGLPEIIRGFKTFSSRKINLEIGGSNKFQWQKSFYDHVIRNEKSLHNLRQYILNNPLKWELDIENKKGLNICSIQKSCKDYYKEIIDGR
ncbi:MAG: transposase [Thermodesulfobacteriota bacterium]